VEVAISHGTGRRSRTGWEILGMKGVLGIGWAVVAALKGWRADVGTVRQVTERFRPHEVWFRKLIGWEVEHPTPLEDRNVAPHGPLTLSGSSRNSGSSVLRTSSSDASPEHSRSGVSRSSDSSDQLVDMRDV
jgi:hypothetical protein